MGEEGGKGSRMRGPVGGIRTGTDSCWTPSFAFADADGVRNASCPVAGSATASLGGEFCTVSGTFEGIVINKEGRVGMSVNTDQYVEQEIIFTMTYRHPLPQNLPNWL